LEPINDNTPKSRKFVVQQRRVCLDITGEVYGQLTAIRRTENKNNNGCYIWLFRCSCGNEVLREIGNLRSRRDSAKCDTCNLRALSDRSKTHGMSHKGNKTYKSWAKIKERCFIQSNKDYHKYGAIGITLYEPWRSDFQAFYDYIGSPPEDGEKYSIDRIDNNLGYVPGNIRWATIYQQARNKSKSKSNKTGETGVQWDNKIWPCGTKATLYAKACWKESGLNKTKCFNTNTYGKEEAFRLACEYREMMIARLNADGAGYSPDHGKERQPPIKLQRL
jgi:hypothetical protein